MKSLPLCGLIVPEYLRCCEAFDFISRDVPIFPERGCDETIDVVGIDPMKGRGVLCEVMLASPGDKRTLRNSEKEVLDKMERKLKQVRRFVMERMCVLRRGVEFQVWTSSMSAGFRGRMLKLLENYSSYQGGKVREGVPGNYKTVVTPPRQVFSFQIIAGRKCAKRLDRLRQKVDRASVLWLDLGPGRQRQSTKASKGKGAKSAT